jgi:hypothetical protein
MKTKTPALLITVSLLLASRTFAQNAGSASSVAQNAAANASQNANAASRAASVSAANAVGAQTAAAHSPATTGVTSNAAAATTAAGASIPTTKGTLNAGLANSITVPGNRDNPRATDATVDVSATARGTATAPGLSAEGNPGGKIAASLNAPATTEHIRSATKVSRDDVFHQIDSDIAASKQSLAHLRSTLSDSDKANRDRVSGAEIELRIREKELRQSLNNARHASAENADAAQAKLADAYKAYASAVAQTEAAMDASASAVVGVKR